MQLTEALRWTIYYRGIALVSFLIGAALAAVGVWYGFVDIVLSQLPGTAGNATVDVTGLAVGTALILLGFVVWQIGKTAAFYMTLTEATENQMADRLDTQTVKSEILEVLDDRLSDIHTDVETTRQQVDRLGIEDHADSLTDDQIDGRTGSTTGSQRPGDDDPSDIPGTEPDPPTGDR